MTRDAGHGLVPQAGSDEREVRFERRSARRSALLMLVAAVILAAIHVGVQFAWPVLMRVSGGVVVDESVRGLRPTLNLGWYVAHLFLAACVFLTGRRLKPIRLVAYAIGYAVVVWLLWPAVVVMQENLLLVILSIVVYGSLLRRPWLLGYLFIFLGCQRYLPAYLYPSFVITALAYTTLPPFVGNLHRQRRWFMALCHLAGLILLTCLLVPVLFYCMGSSSQDVEQRLHDVDVLAALGVSLKSSAIATLIVLVFGVPLAYSMVRVAFPGRGLIDTLIDLPIVVPPPIVGLILLAFVGPKSPLGVYLETRFGIEFSQQFAGIVLAQVFVGSPYLIRASMVAFAAVDVRHENVARTLGASAWGAFVRVALPMSLRGILIGVILTWFRAMAEFGALQLLANRPRTLSVFAYEEFIDWGQSEAQSVGVLILLLCLCVIVGMWIIRSMPAILGKSIGASDAAR